MWQRLFNWRNLLLVIALCIVAGTVVYTSYLAKKIAREERQRIQEWVLANRLLQYSDQSEAISLSNAILYHNEDIPLIATDETGAIVDYRNLDSLKAATDTAYLNSRWKQLAADNPPIDWPISDSPAIVYKVYYGNSNLLREVQYYPYVQLLLVAMFFALALALLQARNRSVQNQVWAGMAKETAHQLGTPLTSMEGWLALLRDNPGDDTVVQELEADVDRLKRVSDRFGKIGSTPKLEPTDLNTLLLHTESYSRARASEKVLIVAKTLPQPAMAMLSATLFEWVLENLVKNALDAMEGNGTIVMELSDHARHWIIDVADTGKGISSEHLGRVFSPGFTTKKRGWGLGLSLSKRIVTQYHHGTIRVLRSEPGIGTTFRIELPK